MRILPQAASRSPGLMLGLMLGWTPGFGMRLGSGTIILRPVQMQKTRGRMRDFLRRVQKSSVRGRTVLMITSGGKYVTSDHFFEQAARAVLHFDRAVDERTEASCLGFGDGASAQPGNDAGAWCVHTGRWAGDGSGAQSLDSRRVYRGRYCGGLVDADQGTAVLVPAARGGSGNFREGTCLSATFLCVL